MGARYIEIYSPFTGRNWGQSNYCFLTDANGVKKAHTIVGAAAGRSWASQPIDVGGGVGGGEVRFKANSVCRSIKVSNFDGICGSGVTPYTYGVVVEVYIEPDAKPGSLAGTVLYGHVTGRSKIGVYNTNNRVLGSLIANPETAIPCYSGVHVHMQASANFESNSFSCSQSLQGGKTWIYRVLADIV